MIICACKSYDNGLIYAINGIADHMNDMIEETIDIIVYGGNGQLFGYVIEHIMNRDKRRCFRVINVASG